MDRNSKWLKFSENFFLPRIFEAKEVSLNLLGTPKHPAEGNSLETHPDKKMKTGLTEINFLAGKLILAR